MKLSQKHAKALIVQWEIAHQQSLYKTKIKYSYHSAEWLALSPKNEVIRALSLSDLVHRNKSLIKVAYTPPDPLPIPRTGHNRHPDIIAFEALHKCRFYGSQLKHTSKTKWQCLSSDQTCIVYAASLEELIAECPYIKKPA